MGYGIFFTVINIYLEVFMQPFQLQAHLRELFPVTGYAQPIEVVAPYKGKLGNFSAEIYDPSQLGMSQMISKIQELNLSTRWSYEPEKTADIILSNLEKNPRAVQLVFTTDQAFSLFSNAMMQIQSTRSDIRSYLSLLDARMKKPA